VWDVLVSHSSSLYPAELLNDIDQAYREGVVDPFFIAFEDVKRDLAMGMDQALKKVAEDVHLGLVEDTVKEMAWWTCFREDESSPVTAGEGPAERTTTGMGPVAPPVKLTEALPVRRTTRAWHAFQDPISPAMEPMFLSSGDYTSRETQQVSALPRCFAECAVVARHLA
jgi:hypothetical protein